MKVRSLFLMIFLNYALLSFFAFPVVAGEKKAPAEPVAKGSRVAERDAGKDDWETVLKKARQEKEVAVIGGTSVAALKSSIKLFNLNSRIIVTRRAT